MGTSPFLPTTPSDFEMFLRLYLGDKRAPLDKDSFAAFLTAFETRDQSLTSLRRVTSAMAILANYILSGYENKGNHLAVAEGWILVVAHMLRLAEGSDFDRSEWMDSVSLCIDAWRSAVLFLTREALDSPNWVEGDPAIDHAVHSQRGVLLLGYLATVAINEHQKTGRLDLEDMILSKVKSNLSLIFSGYWGESASPFVFAIILLLWLHGDEGLAVDIAGQLIAFISRNNHPDQKAGVPDPYYDLSTLQGLILGQDVFDRKQSFAGRSFTTQYFVEFIARRGWKQRLRSLWHDLTFVDRVQFCPDDHRDYYSWRAKKGTEVSRRWGQPQIWHDLVNESTSQNKPKLLLTDIFPSLVLPFLFVYPHRATPELMRLVESIAAEEYSAR